MCGCQHNNDEYSRDEEIRGIWISCYDWISTEGKNREEYKHSTDEMFENISKAGLNTAFVHLRAFSDSFYKSDNYSYSNYIVSNTEPEYDPFEVMLESAEKYGISVHGWINPFRISYSGDLSELNEPALSLYETEETAVCSVPEGIFYNPSSLEAQKLILNGIKEIITKYPVYGIHIDDYFYPSQSEEIDKKEYSDYISSGGKLSLEDWRRAIIDSFVSALYNCVKSIDGSLTVSISPGGNNDRNYSELYADCKKWLSSPGYADLIIPQLYFAPGFGKYDFDTCLNEWDSYKRLDSVKILCGLAGYKCGTDERNWKTDTDILCYQLNECRKRCWNGFVLFSYSDLIKKSVEEWINPFVENIKK